MPVWSLRTIVADPLVEQFEVRSGRPQSGPCMEESSCRVTGRIVLRHGQAVRQSLVLWQLCVFHGVALRLILSTITERRHPREHACMPCHHEGVKRPYKPRRVGMVIQLSARATQSVKRLHEPRANNIVQTAVEKWRRCSVLPRSQSWLLLAAGADAGVQ